jgi:DNA-binding NarL/FixJ family response regulator
MTALNPVPSNTMDVTSLYINIPHSDGIEACKEIWESRSVKRPLAETIGLLGLLALWNLGRR